MAFATATFLLAVTLYYGVIFQGQLPDHPMLRGQNDLFLHFIAFLALTLPVGLLFPRWPYYSALASFAAVIEAIQIFQPDRNADFNDFIAGFLGVLLGAALIAIIQRILEPNHE
ncbi:VanZ family protein [uncultured Sulfitobacter sp.]|uniref:VanZ family protein n=1 Tax=uncultured Sulfitobacter sp. TaxID=191468 RepID=UPI0025DEC668|nr:VanZ family protein [uncultured Sulfitobacter sp.]